MRIFAGVPWRRGVKRQWGCRKWQCSVLSLLISSEALEAMSTLLYTVNRSKHIVLPGNFEQPSRSSKVVDFCTNRERVCDFLLVIHSNLGPILPLFRDITGLPRTATPSLFHPNFRRVPLGLDCRCCDFEERRP